MAPLPRPVAILAVGPGGGHRDGRSDGSPSDRCLSAERRIREMIQEEDAFREPGQRPSGGSGSGATPQEPDALTMSPQYAGTSLRLQVLEIINSVLNSTEPELEEVRVRLRSHVKEHPWNPEIALLMPLWDSDQTPPPDDQPGLRPRGG
jgi:hypothetical protein